MLDSPGGLRGHCREQQAILPPHPTPVLPKPKSDDPE